MARHGGRRGGGLVLLAFVVFVVGLWGGWQLLTRPSGGAVAYQCTAQTIRAGEQLPSSAVTVDVFNGGGTEGIAGRVSSELQARGFRQGSIANSQSAVKPAAVTILTAHPSDPRVQLVARQFRAVRYHAPDITVGSGVTVLIGDGFKSLNPSGPRSMVATRDVSICY